MAETKKQGRIGLERNLKKAGLITKKKGPASIHRKLQRSSKRSKKLSKNAMRIVDTSANLVEGYVKCKQKRNIFPPLLIFFSLKSLQSFLLILNSKSKWSKVLLKSNYFSSFLRFCTQDISQDFQRTVEDFSKYFLKT